MGMAQNGHRSRLADAGGAAAVDVTHSNKAGGSGIATVDRIVDRRVR